MKANTLFKNFVKDENMKKKKKRNPRQGRERVRFEYAWQPKRGKITGEKEMIYFNFCFDIWGNRWVELSAVK